MITPRPADCFHHWRPPTDCGQFSISDANQKAIEAAGLSFILGMKIPDVPYLVAQWCREHPGVAVSVTSSRPPDSQTAAVWPVSRVGTE